MPSRPSCLWPLRLIVFYLSYKLPNLEGIGLVVISSQSDCQLLLLPGHCETDDGVCQQVVAGVELLHQDPLAGVERQKVVGERVVISRRPDAGVPVIESQTHSQVTAGLQHGVAGDETSHLGMG